MKKFPPCGVLLLEKQLKRLFAPPQPQPQPHSQVRAILLRRFWCKNLAVYFLMSSMKRIGEYLGSSRERARSFIVHNVLHADDPPHQLALGIGIAMFVTFTPTIGFQMGLVFALCWIFGGNKLVGLPLVWISNPATIVPIYYPCLWLGEALMGKAHRNFVWFKNMFSGAPVDWLPKVKFYGGALKDIAIELWLGCIVIGGILGILAYFLTYWLVYTYRMRVWGQLTPPIYHLRHHADADHHGTETLPPTTDALEK